MGAGEMIHVTVNDLTVEVVRKNIKNLNLTVYPPDGRVRLSVPKRASRQEIESFIGSKTTWIKEKQKGVKLREDQARPVTHYLPGELHDLAGKTYRLRHVFIKKGKQRVVIVNDPTADTMELYIRPDHDFESRQRIVQAFYREYLNEKIPEYISKWESVMGVTVKEWRVKRMKTRWGTCNIRDKRIWINLELAKKKLEYLEYIVVHELTHLLEKHHNDRFKGYMDKFMPEWQRLKDELNKY